jgi:DNA-binding transcriptional MerR regulator
MGTITDKLTRERVDAIAAALRQLPEREAGGRAVSKQETVKLLSKEIKALRQRGYSLRDIAEILSNQGVSFTPATLSNFLWRAGLSKKAKHEAAAPQQARRDTPPARPAPNPAKATFTIRPDTPDI